jgi:hypothetical protein
MKKRRNNKGLSQDCGKNDWLGRELNEIAVGKTLSRILQYPHERT